MWNSPHSHTICRAAVTRVFPFVNLVVLYIALLVVGFQLRDCRPMCHVQSDDILQVSVPYVHWFEDPILRSSGLIRDDFRSASSGLWGARYEEGKSPGSEVQEGLGVDIPANLIQFPICSLWFGMFLHCSSSRFNRSTQARLHQSLVLSGRKDLTLLSGWTPIYIACLCGIIRHHWHLWLRWFWKWILCLCKASEILQSSTKGQLLASQAAGAW